MGNRMEFSIPQATILLYLREHTDQLKQEIAASMDSIRQLETRNKSARRAILPSVLVALFLTVPSVAAYVDYQTSSLRLPEWMSLFKVWGPILSLLTCGFSIFAIRYQMEVSKGWRKELEDFKLRTAYVDGFASGFQAAASDEMLAGEISDEFERCQNARIDNDDEEDDIERPE